MPHSYQLIISVFEIWCTEWWFRYMCKQLVPLLIWISRFWKAKFKFEKFCHDIAFPVKLNCQSLPAHFYGYTRLQLDLFTRHDTTSSISQKFRKRFMNSPSNKLRDPYNVTCQTLFFTVINTDHIVVSSNSLFITQYSSHHSLDREPTINIFRNQLGK